MRGDPDEGNSQWNSVPIQTEYQLYSYDLYYKYLKAFCDIGNEIINWPHIANCEWSIIILGHYEFEEMRHFPTI